MSSHSAIGPALGYYYQAIYALICLLDSQNDDAFVSLETLDDVYHEDGDTKNLTQLKHKTISSKISIKHDDLWSTLKVWCDFIQSNDPRDGIFTLSTVASVNDDSVLNVLKEESSDRDELEKELLNEANRVISERVKVKKENLDLRKKGEKEKLLPYGKKYKGCEAFTELNKQKRKNLLKNIRINTDTFSIDQSQNEVIKKIRKSTKKENQISLAEAIISWWDREAVRSLTRERKECIYFSELQEFISKKNSELYSDGFTDDIDEMELPAPDWNHKIHLAQLDIIEASETQKRRSFNTEVKARIQRENWMKNFSLIPKLKKYDEKLIDEWSYKFDEVDKNILEEEKKSVGRSLLDWSHTEAINQVKSISRNYRNPDLIRGSYQMLSKDKRVGWHRDYKSLISEDENE
ncbi:ABC-three component system protein [uncultured Kordia sp.]|uniref:ABC-three component system protein n=1 Tax=uncultured Kordia sp. TaxID=507699 RepID=UPI00263320B8|nr:ABC-three component system protein [uncultured Kordia sp.]